MKIKILIPILILCGTSLTYGTTKSKPGFVEKKEYTLLDYDRAYVVDLSVDTTMRLNQLPGYAKQKGARYTTPHKVHCNFKVLFMWKNNFVVRALVQNLKQLPTNSINLKKVKNKYFSAIEFDQISSNYECYYHDDCYRICIDYAFPPPVIIGEEQIYVPDYYFGPYLLTLNNKLYSLSFDYVDFLKCTPPTLSSKKHSIYCTWDKHHGGPYDDIFTGKNDIIILKNYIWHSLFPTRRNVLIPEALPYQYANFKGFVYNKSCCEGSNITVKAVKVGDKAMYLVENLLNMCNGDYRYKQRLLYIPHVLYLPYSKNIKFISLDKQNRLVNTDYYFRYKINAINGQPFSQFMAGYKDDFKAKIHITKRKKFGNQAEDIPLIIDNIHADPPTTTIPVVVAQISDKIYSGGEVQVMPNFPGGMNALYDYIGKNLQYPASARESGIEGKVIVSFTVEKDGCISDIRILRSLDPDCDVEAIRLIQSMPAWNPGKQADKPVRTSMNLPIVFKLQN